MQTELSRIVQNFEESHVFFVRKLRVSKKQVFESFVLGQNC